MAEPAKAAAAPATLAAPAPAKPAPKPSANIQLKKGMMLFTEGEMSRSMYFLKSGMIRIFKKKGDSQIEIDTIHAGQIIGELAFLDGNPRSAGGEALTDCTLVDISAQNFIETMAKLPDWLKLLMKTLVGRLRTASTRLKQLEEASMSYDYGKDGKKGPHFVYLSTIDVLKLLTGVLVVSARNGTKETDGINVRVGLLQRYCNQIMGVPVAKITDMLDVLEKCDIIKQTGKDDGSKCFLKDIDFLEKYIAWQNEENLKESAKRRVITAKGFVNIALIVKYMGQPSKDTEGNATINLAEVKAKAKVEAGGKDIFKMEDFEEVHTQKLCGAPQIKSNELITTVINVDQFFFLYRCLRVQKMVEALNEDKVNKKTGK